ncbi:MAG: LacI family transcriptional regulator [Bacteroidetes bacterium]|nr:LacI family transcriptional regulator [Bacteroidota bacterium]
MAESLTPLPHLAQMSTIKEVAKRAGVSTATVSRVFNNTGAVDDDTRDRVKLVATELRYIPSALGRSLSTRRTDSIGLLLPDLFGEFFSEVIRGSDQTAQQHKYHLLVSSSHNNREEIAAALKMMRGRVDGLVVMSPHIDAQTLNANLPHNHPVVLLNCHVEGNTFDSLNIDNVRGARQMVDHLISHGHRRVAIIKGTEHNIDAEERLAGYSEAMIKGGGENDGALQFPGDFSEASGYDAVKMIMELTPRPTAIFASNDSMAIGALSALRDSGIQVPQDMALAGFDDVPIAAYLTPSLTSVRVGIHRLGTLAIERVLVALEKKDTYVKQQQVLPTTLSIRESCGCSFTREE